MAAVSVTPRALELMSAASDQYTLYLATYGKG